MISSGGSSHDDALSGSTAVFNEGRAALADGGFVGWRFGRSGLRSSCGEKRSRSENVTRLLGSQL